MSGPDYFGFAVQNAREAFIDDVVNETLDRHGIGRRTEPLCQTCHVPMRHVTGDLWQCPKCKIVEAL